MPYLLSPTDTGVHKMQDWDFFNSFEFNLWFYLKLLSTFSVPVTSKSVSSSHISGRAPIPHFHFSSDDEVLTWNIIQYIVILYLKIYWSSNVAIEVHILYHGIETTIFAFIRCDFFQRILIQTRIFIAKIQFYNTLLSLNISLDKYIFFHILRHYLYPGTCC